MQKPQDLITNKCFDEIQVGDSASINRRLTMDDIKLFAVMSGDVIRHIWMKIMPKTACFMKSLHMVFGAVL